MEPITLMPLVTLYQVCWHAAQALLYLAAMGSPMAVQAISYLLRQM